MIFRCKSDPVSLYISTIGVRGLACKSQKRTPVFLVTHIRIQKNIVRACCKTPRINHSWSMGPGLSFSIKSQVWMLLSLWLPWEKPPALRILPSWTVALGPQTIGPLGHGPILPSQRLQDQRSLWDGPISPAGATTYALAAGDREQTWPLCPP